MTTEFRPTPDDAPPRTAPGRAATAAAPAPRRSGTSGPGLRLVDARARRAAQVRRTLVTALVGVLVATLFAVGLIQAQLVQRQQRLDDLRAQIAETEAQQLRLSRDVVVASSPEEIVRRATELGMVRAAEPVYMVAVRPVVAG